MGSPRGRRRLREQGHNLTGHNSRGSIKRPHAAEIGQVRDSCRFNMISLSLIGATPQETVPANSLRNRDSGNVYLVIGQIRSHPVAVRRLRGAPEPAFGAGIEQERTGRRINHPLLAGDFSRMIPSRIDPSSSEKPEKALLYPSSTSSLRSRAFCNLRPSERASATTVLRFTFLMRAIRCASERDSAGSVSVVRRFFRPDTECDFRLTDAF
jgi:hypothetical protein